MKLPFLEKRDIVGDIKRKPKRLRNKSIKNKYALIIEEEAKVKQKLSEKI